MSYLVLARRWRPQTFEQIRGQDHIVRALRNAITSGRIAHAYVFTGIRGVGKTSAARVLAKALNCANGPTVEPCNRCEFCQEITEGRAADVLEIDGASNTGVDDVRKLREAVRYPPVKGRYRVYIIDEVHMLSTAAFNALLKTLEEPPPHVVFVFATTDAHKIPVTILSRCQQFDFKRLSPRELMALLGDIAASEEISIEERALIALAREADGSVRDAQSLLDQVISYAGQSVTYADVRDVLGAVDRDCLLGVARAVVERDPKAVLERMADAERFGYDVRRFSSDLLDVFRDFAVIKAVEDAEDLIDLAPEEAREARDVLRDLPWEGAHALFDMLSRGVEALRTSARPGVVLEMTLLKMARMPPLLSLSEIVAAVKQEGVSGAPSGAEQGRRERRSHPAPGLPEATTAPEQRPGPRGSPQEPRSATETAGQTPPVDAEPALPPATEPKPAVPDAAPPLEAGRLWEALLSAMETSNRPFWAVLKGHAVLESWNADRKLAVVAYDDPAQQFLLTARQDVLLSALRSIAGPGSQLELKCVRAETPRARNGAEESDRARKLKKEALEHPLVRHALEIFDGDVEEVRALKP